MLLASGGSYHLACCVVLDPWVHSAFRKTTLWLVRVGFSCRGMVNDEAKLMGVASSHNVRFRNPQRTVGHPIWIFFLLQAWCSVNVCWLLTVFCKYFVLSDSLNCTQCHVFNRTCDSPATECSEANALSCVESYVNSTVGEWGCCRWDLWKVGAKEGGHRGRMPETGLGCTVQRLPGHADPVAEVHRNWIGKRAQNQTIG